MMSGAPNPVYSRSISRPPEEDPEWIIATRTTW